MKTDKTKFGNTLNLMQPALGKQYRGHEVKHVWAIIAIDQEGNEGIPAIMKKGFVTPLLCTTQENVDKIVKGCDELMASDPTMRLVLRQFSDGTDIKEIHDGKKD